MSLLRQTYYTEHLELILIFALIGFVLHKIAQHKGFYKLPPSKPFIESKINFLHVLVGFTIYLLCSALLFPWILAHVHIPFISHQTFAIWTQLLVLFFSVSFLLLFSKTFLKKEFHEIWKSSDSSSSKLDDVIIAIGAWLTAFPLVGIVEQLGDLFVYATFGLETYEQVAVRYLKMALQSPPQLIAALSMILIAAPLVEEWLFRGLLQTWMKKHIGIKASILLASLCFALFHISPTHGAGNISLIPALFTFSCFLGFIYERQQSLFASISLHTLFNLITTLRIIFTPDNL